MASQSHDRLEKLLQTDWENTLLGHLAAEMIRFPTVRTDIISKVLGVPTSTILRWFRSATVKVGRGDEENHTLTVKIRSLTEKLKGLENGQCVDLSTQEIVELLRD